jgi:drug/metabolite transporter (DMT)-like permease
MHSTRRPETAGYIFALLATVIWSGNFIVARGLADAIGPVSLAFFRWSTATLVLLPFAARGLRRELPAIRHNIRHLLLTSLLGVTVFNTVIYIAGHLTTALNLSLIAVFTPVFIIILGRLFLGETITPKRLAGAVLSIAGVVTLTVHGDFARLANLQFNPGDLLMLLATLIFAAYSILVRKKPSDIGPTTYLAATFILGLIMLFPWAMLEWTTQPPGIPAAHVIGSILYIGIGASLLSYLFWNRAIASIGPSTSGMVYFSLPLFCGIEAWLILGEPVTWVHAISGLAIIAGIVLATRSR